LSIVAIDLIKTVRYNRCRFELATRLFSIIQCAPVTSNERIRYNYLFVDFDIETNTYGWYMNNQRSAASRKRTELPPPPPVPQKQVPNSNKKPISNVRAGETRQGMSVSDAIGMTTIRLCRVEQLLNMQGNKEKEKEKSIDVSVLGSIVERIGLLEESFVSIRDDIAHILERLNETDTNQVESREGANQVEE
jgi:hypothetical protein